MAGLEALRRTGNRCIEIDDHALAFDRFISCGQVLVGIHRHCDAHRRGQLAAAEHAVGLGLIIPQAGYLGLAVILLHLVTGDFDQIAGLQLARVHPLAVTVDINAIGGAYVPIASGVLHEEALGRHTRDAPAQRGCKLLAGIGGCQAWALNLWDRYHRWRRLDEHRVGSQEETKK